MKYIRVTRTYAKNEAVKQSLEHYCVPNVKRMPVGLDTDAIPYIDLCKNEIRKNLKLPCNKKNRFYSLDDWKSTRDHLKA